MLYVPYPITSKQSNSSKNLISKWFDILETIIYYDLKIK